MRPSATSTPQRTSAAFTLVEVMVAVGIIAVLLALAVPGMSEWAETQKVRGAARSVADALLLARSEAMRTGDNHVVFFGNDDQLDPSGNAIEWAGSWVPVLVINDGPPATANCRIDGGERVDRVEPVNGVRWGASGAANRVGTDAGPAPWTPGDLSWDGATFARPGGAKGNWILFRPDGVPVTFQGIPGGCGNIGTYGSASGAFYLTTIDGQRDFAVVLTPLGSVRLHGWSPVESGWTN